MKSDRIRLALFGVGRWGSNLLRNFLTVPAVELTAVVESNRERLEQVQQQFALSAVALTTDAEAVLARPDIDAVVIATPAATHYALIETALKNRKHVLAEKPLTLTVAESEALCRLADQQQRQLVIDHTYLFHPAVTTGKTVLAEQPLGELRYGYATRTNLGPVRHDVDALWDLAIHDITIFNHWLGAKPIEVSAQGQVWLQPEIDAASHFPGLADVVWLRLFYPSGFQATIHVSWANPDKQRRLCVVGDRGALMFNEMQPDTPLAIRFGNFEPDGSSFMPAGLSHKAVSVPSVEPLKQVCQHFVQCITQNSRSGRSDGRVATDLVRVLVALSSSLKTDGKRVAVDN